MRISTGRRTHKVAVGLARGVQRCGRARVCGEPWQREAHVRVAAAVAARIQRPLQPPVVVEIHRLGQLEVAWCWYMHMLYVRAVRYARRWCGDCVLAAPRGKVAALCLWYVFSTRTAGTRMAHTHTQYGARGLRVSA